MRNSCTGACNIEGTQRPVERGQTWALGSLCGLIDGEFSDDGGEPKPLPGAPEAPS